MNTVQNGKGSKPRKNDSLKQYEDGWERIFSKMKKFYITFGFNQGHDNCYVIVNAQTNDDARQKMIDVYGLKWGFIYESAEDAGVEEYKLIKINEIR